MKEFNLEEYLKNPNREVFTRDGRKVRIICTDKSGLYTQPIVALITIPSGEEIVKCFWEDGTELRGDNSRNDLFFAPTKHEGWINLNRCLDGKLQCGFIYDSEAEAKSNGRNAIATVKIEWEE